MYFLLLESSIKINMYVSQTAEVNSIGGYNKL